MRFTSLGGFLASLFLCGATAHAQVASQPASQPVVQLERVGQFGGAAQALAARDNVALLGLGPSLLVLEQNGRDLNILATLPIGIAARDIALVGDMAWIATGGPDLLGVDITKADAPRIVQRVALPDARRIAAADDLLLVGLADSAVAVVVLQKDEPPRVVRRLALRGEPLSLAIARDVACAALGDAGVTFLRLSRTDPPQLLANFHTLGAVGVALQDKCAFVALRERGMHVLDIADPANPRAATYLPLKNPAEHVAVCGPAVYAALSQGGLLRLQLNRVGNWETLADQDPGNALARLVSTGPTLWALTNTATPRVHVYRRKGDADDLTPVAELSLLGRGVSLAILGERAYVADLSEHLKVIDVHNPAQPHQVGTVPCDEDASYCRAGGGLLLVGERGGVIEVFTGASDEPHRRGDYRTSGLVCDARPLGDTRWVVVGSALEHTGPEGVARQSDGRVRRLKPGGPGLLKVVDFENPAEPRALGGLQLRAIGTALAVHGDFAYVVDQNGGLDVVDLSDPGVPTLAAYFHTEREVNLVLALGRQVVLADGGGGGLLVLDVAISSAPQFRAEIPTGGVVSGLARVGRLLAVSEGTNTVRLLAAGSGDAWLPLAAVPSAGAPAELVACGDMLWVADRTAGLVAYYVRAGMRGEQDLSP